MRSIFFLQRKIYGKNLTLWRPVSRSYKCIAINEPVQSPDLTCLWACKYNHSCLFPLDFPVCLQSLWEIDLDLYEKVTANNIFFLCNIRYPCKPTNKSKFKSSLTKPILSFVRRNGVSSTFEIPVLKPPLWLNPLRVSLLDLFPIG